MFIMSWTTDLTRGRQSSFLRLVGLWLAAILVVTCGGEDALETLCVPGENIFCRCRGGAAGTKLCLDDGNSFGSCESLDGDCDEQPSAGVVSGTGGGGNQISGSGGSPPPPPDGELLAPCTSDSECKTGSCPMGFCSQSCTSYEECAPPEPASPGDCINFEGQAWCVPYCIEQDDCAIYGEDTGCGFTSDALPPYDITACAAWGEALMLPPDGYPPDGLVCVADVVCNLGFEQTERVCSDGDCTAGCHVASDCPEAVECSSDGESLGTCGGGSDDPDVCPGQAVTLSTADDFFVFQGDTSTLRGASDYEGTGLGAGSSGDEHVCAVTTPEAGELVIEVSATAPLDPQVYTRSVCAGGAQTACSDEIGEGVTESFEVQVNVGDTTYIFVDGWNGTEGPFQIAILFG